ncbi:MAG: cytochrome D1 domain-containing protein [Steroidobacteraceae bacterium]
MSHCTPSPRRWALALLAIAAACSQAQADTLLVVRKSADAVDFIDPGSGLRLASVAVGHAPHEISVSPDGRFAAVSNYGSAERPGSTLSIIDLQQPRELRRLDLAPHSRPHGLDWFAPDRLALTTQGSQSLLLVDPTAGRIVAATGTGQDTPHMVAVAPDGRRAYVANIVSGSVTVIDLAAGTASGTVVTGAGTEAIAVRPGGTQVWTFARGDGALVIMDAATLERISTAEVPGIPIRVAFTPDGSTAFVTRAALGEVTAFDAATGKPVARRRLEVPLAADADSRPFAGIAPGSPLPVGLVVARDGRTIFVAATMADRVVQLDARTLEVLRSIAVDGEPDGLGLTPVVPKAVCHACAPEAPPAP